MVQHGLQFCTESGKIKLNVLQLDYLIFTTDFNKVKLLATQI